MSQSTLPGSPTDDSVGEPLGAWLKAGFTRQSALTLAAVLLMYSVVGLNWRNLIDPSKGMDWLLGGIWLGMTTLLVWRIDLRRDLPLALVGLAGGAVIEWWGTTTELWTYFTRERPPLWILPAWPVAALSIERLSRITGRVFPALHRTGPLYWPVMVMFVLLMGRFLWPTIDQPASVVVVGLMVGVTVIAARPGPDMVRFITGATLGILLEYWGTSRRCWTYYTNEVPPIEAILAHGFATVAFARAEHLVMRAWARIRRTQPPSDSSATAA